MKIFLNGCEAVSELHKNGFTNDFQLLGNGLLWVQEQILIRRKKFVILEYHKIFEPRTDTSTITVFGIFALHFNVKGILINRYHRCSTTTPPGLVDALNQLKADAWKNHRRIFQIEN